MPCETEGYDEGPSTLEKLNTVTDMLCWVLSHLKTTSWLRGDILVWWKLHQEYDRKRKKEEADWERQRIKDLEFHSKETAMELAALKKKYGVK